MVFRFFYLFGFRALRENPLPQAYSTLPLLCQF